MIAAFVIGYFVGAVSMLVVIVFCQAAAQRDRMPVERRRRGRSTGRYCRGPE